MKKTALSLAISFALWGGMPSSYAQISPPPMGQAAQQQPMPQPTGEQQPLPLQPGADGQLQQPQPGEGGQPQPPQPGANGQPEQSQPGEGGQALPPQSGEGGQPQQPQPDEGGQPQLLPQSNGKGPQKPNPPGYQPPKLPPCTVGKHTGNPSGSANQQCQPRLEDLGIRPQELDGFDQLAEEEIRAFGPQEMQQVSPQAFNNLGPDQVQKMPKEALEGITPTQFQQMPADALTGLESHNMAGLPPEVIKQFQPQHLEQLDKSHFQAMPDDGIGKLLVNMNPENIQPENVKPLLPENWQMDDNGGVKPPPGTKLALPAKSKKPMSLKVKMPEMPDMSEGFGLGGNAVEGKTVLQGLNEALVQAGAPNFSFKQQDNGSLIVEGSGEASGVQLAFMPASNEMMQTEEGAPIAQDEMGRFVLTTQEDQQFPMIPTVKDPEGLANAIPGDGEVQIGESGDTLLKLPNQPKHPRVVGMVDSLVTQAPSGMSPGVHFAKTPDGQEEAMLVYQDGTMQQMRPTCRSPQQFIEKSKEIEGVENVTHQMDGTFVVVFMGKRYRLRPTFDVQVEPVTEDEVVESSILSREDGSLEYIVRDEEEVLHTKVVIEEIGIEEGGIEEEMEEMEEGEEENEVVIEDEV